MTNPNVRFVVFRYAHHSPHSGYSRVAEFGVNTLKGEVIRIGKPLPRAIIRERLLWRLAKGTPGYDRGAMAAELQVALKMLKQSDYIYHFLYGETTYHYAGYLNNFRRNRVIATFHLPPVGIQHAVQIDWHIRQLSAIICVGRNQQEFFADRFDRERTFFVPLGVDTEYYTPPADSSTRDPDLCLVVGENYRDYPTLRGVIELVSFLRPKTQFVSVGSRSSSEFVGVHPNYTVRSGISEAELVDLYRAATLLVMPLHDTTANNAVLEGLACGLPLVASDVGAIRDYVNPKCAALVRPHDARCMAEAILALLDAPAERQKMAEQARTQALKFAWPTVMQELGRVYAKIA